MCEVKLGYRGDDSSSAVTMFVSKDALVLDSFTFTPDDVVEIRIQHSWFLSAVLVLDHILFEQIPNEVIISPISESCELLIERIRIAGFSPKAQRMIPWIPPDTPSPLL